MLSSLSKSKKELLSVHKKRQALSGFYGQKKRNYLSFFWDFVYPFSDEKASLFAFALAPRLFNPAIRILPD